MLPSVKVNVTEEVLAQPSSLNTFIPLVIVRTKTGPIGTEVLVGSQKAFEDLFGTPDETTPEAYGVYKYIGAYGYAYVVRVASNSAEYASGIVKSGQINLVQATTKYKTDELNGKVLKLILDSETNKLYLSLVVGTQTITSIKETINYATATAHDLELALDKIVNSFNEAQKYLVLENKFVEKTSEDEKPSTFTELSADITGGVSGNTSISDSIVEAIIEYYRGSDIGFDAILAPGLESTDVVNKLSDVAADSSFIAIAGASGTVSSITTAIASYNKNSSLIIYAGNVKEGNDIQIPASIAALPAYIVKDRSSRWLAPAGVTRGTLSLVTDYVEKYSDDQLETLYNNIIPVNGFKKIAGKGYIVWGQKTASPDASQYQDRANIVRLVKYLEKEIYALSYDYLFEPITNYTYNSWTLRVEALLEDIKQGSGLSDYKVIMDDTINTEETKAQNKLLGIVRFKPLEAAEFIEIDFTITDNVEGGNA